MNQLRVTFEGPSIREEGVSIDDFASATKGIQSAVRLMVEHLGNRPPRGRPPQWVNEQSSLRLMSVHPGSIVADFTVGRPSGDQQYLRGYGEQALQALLSWDGSADSTLPKRVTDKLYQISSNLPSDVSIWMGTDTTPRRVKIERTKRATKPAPRSEESLALLHGWLKEVNWDRRTAQLHTSGGGYIKLRFDDALSQNMRRLATQYVEVSGNGSFNQDDQWTSVLVEHITDTENWEKPSDIEAHIEAPNPRIFHSSRIVRISDPIDVDEFIRSIRDGRED